MDSRKYYYARVSTNDQNLERQLSLFRSMGAQEHEIITDKKSGKNFNREGYNALKNYFLREGDTLVIKELDRLGRNKKDVKKELEDLRKKGIRVMVCDIPTTMTEFPEGQEWIADMVNNILIEVYASIAEQERLKTEARSSEGRAAMPVGKDGKKYSLKTGNPTGRPKIEYPLEWEKYYSDWKAGLITARSCMASLNLKKSTFYKLVNEYEHNQTQQNN